MARVRLRTLETVLARFRCVVLADHQHAALAGVLVLRQAPVDAIRLLVLGPDVAVHVGAVDLDHAGQRRIVLVDHQGFPDLVGEHERGLVLHAQVAGQLQRRDALHRVGEQRHGGQVGFQRQLVGVEHRATGHGEGLAAASALPDAAGLDEVVLMNESAARAGNFLPITPAQMLEQSEGVVVAHAGHLEYREGTGTGGEKKVQRGLDHDWFAEAMRMLPVWEWLWLIE